MTASLSSRSASLKSLCILLLATNMSFPQSIPRTLLNHLEGSWLMTGSVMKKPVQYTAKGAWTLRDQFFCLHMKDTASPPKYEADLYIGIDSSKSQYVAHWLDSFGGTGARVVGTGPLSPDKVEIVYPYEKRRFRNLFRYDPCKDEWTLVIESEGSGGHWFVFAQYTITKRR